MKHHLVINEYYCHLILHHLNKYMRSYLKKSYKQTKELKQLLEDISFSFPVKDVNFCVYVCFVCACSKVPLYHQGLRPVLQFPATRKAVFSESTNQRIILLSLPEMRGLGIVLSSTHMRRKFQSHEVPFHQLQAENSLEPTTLKNLCLVNSRLRV